MKIGILAFVALLCSALDAQADWWSTLSPERKVRAAIRWGEQYQVHHGCTFEPGFLFSIAYPTHALREAKIRSKILESTWEEITTRGPEYCTGGPPSPEQVAKYTPKPAPRLVAKAAVPATPKLAAHIIQPVSAPTPVSVQVPTRAELPVQIPKVAPRPAEGSVEDRWQGLCGSKWTKPSCNNSS